MKLGRQEEGDSTTSREEGEGGNGEKTEPRGTDITERGIDGAAAF